MILVTLYELRADLQKPYEKKVRVSVQDFIDIKYRTYIEFEGAIYRNGGTPYDTRWVKLEAAPLIGVVEHDDRKPLQGDTVQ